MVKERAHRKTWIQGVVTPLHWGRGLLMTGLLIIKIIIKDANSKLGAHLISDCDSQ